MLRLYDKKAPKSKYQVLPHVMTFLASGLWHGLEPGYVVTFLAWASLDILAKLLPKTLPAHYFYKWLPRYVQIPILLVWFYHLTFYFTISFVYQRSEIYDRIHQAYGYAFHYIMIALVVSCFVLP